MDWYRWNTFAYKYWKTVDLSSITAKDCPGNITSKDTLIVASSSVSIINFGQVKVMNFLAKGFGNFAENI